MFKCDIVVTVCCDLSTKASVQPRLPVVKGEVSVQTQRGGRVIMRDIISELPDSLLLHILSSESLDTKDVVATSLLSRRWRSLWLSIPKLHFDSEGGFHSRESFLQFIDAALLLVDLNSVKTFVLECDCFRLPSIKVNIWITALIRSKLEHLDLYFGDEPEIRLPASIFICNTIRVIKLSGVILSNLSTVNLPSLRALHLVDVEFLESECLAILLSNRVHLEELLLESLDMPSDDPNLKLDIGKHDHLVSADVSNVSPPSLLPIEMFSNVTYLSLREDDWFLRDDIPTFNNLIHLEMGDLNYKVWPNFVTCLRNFPNLETLVTYEHNTEDGDSGVSNDNDDDVVLMGITPEVPPCVLSHLKVFVCHTINCECEMVRFILEHARVLRDVVIRTAYKSEDHRCKQLQEFISSICPENCRLSVNVGLADEFVVSKRFRY